MADTFKAGRAEVAGSTPFRVGISNPRPLLSPYLDKFNPTLFTVGCIPRLAVQPLNLCQHVRSRLPGIDRPDREGH